MEIIYIAGLLSNISFILLTIAPTVFVFSVTLLGTAIEKSQQEEKSARENDKENLKKEIDDIEKSLKQVRRDGNTVTLDSKLEVLRKKQGKSEENINEIKIKYSRINLNNSVIYPCVALLLVVLSNPLIVVFQNQFLGFSLVIFSEILLVIYSTIKIYQSLILVQQISENKKESESYSKLKDTIKLALEEYDQGKKEEVSVIFIDKAFPLNTTTSTELEIEFKLKLQKGHILNNVYVWFFVADGFDLLNPKEFWKQDSDYDPPSIRTVRVRIGTVSEGRFWPGTLKIKTPASSGKYFLRYKVLGDGFSGSQKDLSILVG